MTETQTYDDSPERRDEPLGRDELAALAAAGAQLAARPAHVRHILGRMKATVEASEKERDHLRSELARANERSSRPTGIEQTLAALAEMSAGEREKVLGAHLARESALLEQAREDAEMEAVAGRNLLARLLSSAETISEQEGPHVRDLMRRVLQGAGITLR